MAEGVRRVRFTVLGVIGRSGRILWRGIFPILLLSLLVHAPVLAIGLWIIPEYGLYTAGPWSLALLGALLGPLLTAPVTLWTVRRLHGAPKGFGHCLLRGIGRYFPVLVVCFFSNLLFLGTLPLLVIPGIAVAVSLWVAVPVAVMERRGVFGSLHRSAELTRGHRWRVLCLLALNTLCVAALVLASPFGGSMFGGPFSVLMDHYGVSPSLTVLHSFMYWFSVAAVKAALCVVVAVSYHALVVEWKGEPPDWFLLNPERAGNRERSGRVRFTAWGVFGRSVRLLCRSLPLAMPLSLLAALPLSHGLAWLPLSRETATVALLGALSWIIFATVAAPPIRFCVVQRSQGWPAPLRTCILQGLERFPARLTTAVLAIAGRLSGAVGRRTAAGTSTAGREPASAAPERGATLTGGQRRRVLGLAVVSAAAFTVVGALVYVLHHLLPELRSDIWGFRIHRTTADFIAVWLFVALLLAYLATAMAVSRQSLAADREGAGADRATPEPESAG